MRRRLVIGFVLAAALAGSTGAAHANSCNLYSPQRWGEIREGCALTIFVKQGIDGNLPTITRGGQLVTPTIVQDQLTLKVTYEHYPSEDSCDLITSYAQETFDRYVVTWPDLKGGDEVIVDGYPYTIVVPGPGDCGTVDPFFYCQDGIHFCDTQPPQDPASDPNNVDDAGCSAGSGGTGWLAAFGILALLSYKRRSRTSSRR